MTPPRCPMCRSPLLESTTCSTCRAVIAITDGGRRAYRRDDHGHLQLVHQDRPNHADTWESGWSSAPRRVNHYDPLVTMVVPMGPFGGWAQR